MAGAATTNLNCPFDEEQYALFYSALIEAKSVPLQRFEETRWFESCLPIEEIARRGVDTLRFGPMKPVDCLIRARVASLTLRCSCARKI